MSAEVFYQKVFASPLDVISALWTRVLGGGVSRNEVFEVKISRSGVTIVLRQ